MLCWFWLILSIAVRFIGRADGIYHTVGNTLILITTPEAWVPALGDAHHGFPIYLVLVAWY